MASSQSTMKLCIFCRRLESTSGECPTLQSLTTLNQTSSNHVVLNPPQHVSPFSSDDEALIEQLQKQPSHLCTRCTDYDIVSVFKDAEPLDADLLYQACGNDSVATKEYHQKFSRYEIPLPDLPSLLLTPACPVCRLIYRVLPRKGLDPRDNTLKLTPYRSYLRAPDWERLPSESKTQAAILIGIHTPYTLALKYDPRATGGENVGPAQMNGEAICLASESTFPGRKLDNWRFVEPMADLALAKKALDHCLQNCRGACQAEPHAELLLTTMVDVIDRVTVPCPSDDCDYFALSYVWGGVMPTPGALETGTLPQTIEDAITVTKKLGRRYLWVDALCIDQTPNPTPTQAAAKTAQLKMMDLIYGCATLTIVALSGKDSNAGLAGVRPAHRRTKQVRETIGGRKFFTVPPTVGAEREASVWDKRAWTLQESLLSRRKLAFTDTQINFECLGHSVVDAFDFETMMQWPGMGTSWDNMKRLMGAMPPPGTQPGDWYVHGFLGLLNGYTERKMTNDSDSLNALLGILSAWERYLLPSGSTFVWGLPLQHAPQFLGWFHEREVSTTPKRRQSFPSWSWAGWEGRVYIDNLLPENVYPPEKMSRIGDLTVRMVDIVDDRKLVVEGWVVELDIRTEPFSDAYIPGTDDMVGMVKERNFNHNNTLASGLYTCLVVEQVRSTERGRFIKVSVEHERVFLVVLECHAGQQVQGMDVASRQTMITFFPNVKGDFMRAKPEKKKLVLI
ncbi:heterokaryon incompatibility protein-domain-containing protein [Apodospora peruviana]|uniref:Heterokaryon incompatibility protein-domain-containing protein n=1 Tax=Apodospora peruviana TaxID=516989 RepID=A0AAE0IHS7_9PEZI|nr:heterokaryon incompatibility protein-domain-containing protein [Apodospora peruviana]